MEVIINFDSMLLLFLSTNYSKKDVNNHEIVHKTNSKYNITI